MVVQNADLLWQNPLKKHLKQTQILYTTQPFL